MTEDHHNTEQEPRRIPWPVAPERGSRSAIAIDQRREWIEQHPLDALEYLAKLTSDQARRIKDLAERIEALETAAA